MKSIMLIFLLVTVLLSGLHLLRNESVLDVEASANIYQGDLILDDNNVTIIEGYFAINGSIHVRENATLILRNSVINFTKYGSGLRMLDPANGNPRLEVENTEIVGETDNRFFGNSSASFSNTTGNVFFYFDDETTGNFLDSSFDGFQAREDSVVTASNSTVQYVTVVMFDGNASVANVSPGFFDQWDFQESCSVVFMPETEAPEVVINQTMVNNWSFSFQGNCAATVAECELIQLHTNDWSVIDVRDSIIDTVELYYLATVTLTNTTYSRLRPFGSAKVYVNWYLGVNVADDSPTPGQGVQSANVTTSFSNGTLAGEALTGVDGWIRFTLMEKMTNETGSYTVGTYTVNATYLDYSNGTSVNMIGNQEITLTLEGFVIPEFSSFLILPLSIMASSLAIVVLRRRHRVKAIFDKL